MLGEPGACDGPAILRSVAEGEQRLLATEAGAGAGDLEDVLRLHEHRFAPGRQAAGCLNENAVVAAVSAEFGQRNEDLAGVGDDARSSAAGQALVAKTTRRLQEQLEFGAARAEERLGAGAGDRFVVVEAPEVGGHGHGGAVLSEVSVTRYRRGGASRRRGGSS